MLAITPHMRIFAITKPISFRVRFDGTAGICRNIHKRDPYDGSVFVFINHRRTMMRCYIFDGQREWLCDSRIAKGKIPHWINSEEELTPILSHQLYLLLRGGDPNGLIVPEDWRRIS